MKLGVSWGILCGSMWPGKDSPTLDNEMRVYELILARMGLAIKPQGFLA